VWARTFDVALCHCKCHGRRTVAHGLLILIVSPGR